MRRPKAPLSPASIFAIAPLHAEVISVGTVIAKNQAGPFCIRFEPQIHPCLEAASGGQRQFIHHRQNTNAAGRAQLSARAVSRGLNSGGNLISNTKPGDLLPFKAGFERHLASIGRSSAGLYPSASSNSRISESASAADPRVGVICAFTCWRKRCRKRLTVFRKVAGLSPLCSASAASPP